MKNSVITGGLSLKYLITGEKQTLTIPNHSEIDKGTLRAIIRQSSRYISDDDIQKHFYTDN